MVASMVGVGLDTPPFSRCKLALLYRHPPLSLPQSESIKSLLALTQFFGEDFMLVVSWPSSGFPRGKTQGFKGVEATKRTLPHKQNTLQVAEGTNSRPRKQSITQTRCLTSRQHSLLRIIPHENNQFPEVEGGGANELAVKEVKQ